MYFNHRYYSEDLFQYLWFYKIFSKIIQFGTTQSQFNIFLIVVPKLPLLNNSIISLDIY